MIAIKHYLAFNTKIKIILMSATINHNVFANYFSAAEILKLRNRILNEDKVIRD